MGKLVLILPLTFAIFGCKGDKPQQDVKEQLNLVGKQPIHLVIAYGQSNAAGSSPDIQNAPLVPDGWGYLWNGKEQHLSEPTRWNNKPLGSAWSSYAIRFHELTGESVAVINVAIDGKKISELTPNSRKGREMFRIMEDSLAYYINSNRKIKSVSMIYLQGEADSRDLTPIDEYFSSLNSIKSKFLSLHQSSKFYIARIGYNSNFNKEQTNHAFYLGHKQIKFAECPVFAKAPSFQNKGLMSEDGIHYLQEAYNTMGAEIAENIVYYINGTDISNKLVEESKAMQAYNPYKSDSH